MDFRHPLIAALFDATCLLERTSRQAQRRSIDEQLPIPDQQRASSARRKTAQRQAIRPDELLL